MTIDEAIKHTEEVAEEKEKEAWEVQLQEEYKTIKSCKECAKEHRQLAEWLKELKQLREQTRWISVSERLPEKDKYTDFYKCMVARLYTSRSNTCDICIAYFDGKRFLSHNLHGIVSGVKAWMPLPEPYKAEGGDKE